MKGEKVLITGGLGFIGSTLAHRILREGGRVTILDARIPHLGAHDANIEDIKDDVEIIIGDIRDAALVRHALDGKDIIFSLAAQKSHPMSMRDPYLDIDINCRGIVTVLEEARRAGGNVKRIVFPSTTTAVDYPIDMYSADKLVGERYHMLYYKNYGLPVSMVRFPNIYGPRALITSPNGGVANFFIGLAFQGKPLTVYGEGDEMKNLVYVDDAVDALARVAASDKTIGEEPFTVCTDEFFSIREMAGAIVEIFGKGEVAHVEYPKNLVKLKDTPMSNVRIKETVGWRPTTRFREGLEKTIAYYRDRLDAYLPSPRT